MTNLEKDKFVHFDLTTSVEENFNKYQDILEECPEKMHQFKLQFDQYIKSKRLHERDVGAEQGGSVIEFKVAE